MKASFRLGAALIAIALFLAIGTVAKAQPCTTGALIVNNTSPFNITLCLVSVPVIPCVNVPPGLSAVVPIPNPTRITGVTSAGGFNYGWGPNPAPPPALALTSVALPPTGLCYDVTYDPATCTINVTLSGTGIPPCVNP